MTLHNTFSLNLINLKVLKLYLNIEYDFSKCDGTERRFVNNMLYDEDNSHYESNYRWSRDYKMVHEKNRRVYFFDYMIQTQIADGIKLNNKKIREVYFKHYHGCKITLFKMLKNVTLEILDTNFSTQYVSLSNYNMFQKEIEKISVRKLRLCNEHDARQILDNLVLGDLIELSYYFTKRIPQLRLDLVKIYENKLINLKTFEACSRTFNMPNKTPTASFYRNIEELVLFLYDSSKKNFMNNFSICGNETAVKKLKIISRTECYLFENVLDFENLIDFV